MNTDRLPRLFTLWKLIFAAVIAAGLYATWVRVFKGLGASTGLNDDFPWGIWIGFDVMCGVALAAGGFTIAATVYVLHLERFRPILRPTILTAFLGYLMVVVSLMFDLGQPHRIWHPMIMWNSRSVMFEVGWCVVFYNTVLALEFSPAVLERFRFKRTLRVLHYVTPLLVIAGVVLSTLHQSSLGTLFVIAPNKLHGLWYTPWLPVLFYLSAIAVGLAMTIFESYLSNRAFGVSLHASLLASLGKALAVVLGVYLVARLATLAAGGHLPLLFEGSFESLMFFLEIALGTVLPMVMLSYRRVREHKTLLFYSAFLVILGLVLNRMNVGITGMQGHAASIYRPSLLEVATTAAIVAGGVAVFGLAVRYLPIFSAHTPDGKEAPIPWDHVPPGARIPRYATLSTPTGAAIMAGLVLLLAGILAYGQWGGGWHSAPGLSPQSVAGARRLFADRPSTALALPGDRVLPSASASPGPVTFSHSRHVNYNRQACTNCHPSPYPMAAGAAIPVDCSSGHQSCASCHDGRGAFQIEVGCTLCHARPVRGAGESATAPQLSERWLPSFDRTFGAVKFSHDLHINRHRVACQDCHPTPYAKRYTLASDPGMDSVAAFLSWGHQCAQCHDGDRAFSWQEACATCHTRGRALQETRCPAPPTASSAQPPASAAPAPEPASP